LETTRKNRRAPAVWLAVLAGTLSLTLALPAMASAETTEQSNANQRNCRGQIRTGRPELGSEEHQVAYKFVCDGPITGYQITSAGVPITGESESPEVLQLPALVPTADVFSCSSELPGSAIDCTTGAASKATTGVTKEGNVEIQGQFAIETAACKTPKLYPKLTVVYATSEGTFAHNEKGELETVKTKVKVKNKEGVEIEVEGFEPKYETKSYITAPVSLGHTAGCPKPKKHRRHRRSRSHAKHQARR